MPRPIVPGRNAVFARGIQHRLDALLLFVQALRVGIHALLVMAQRVDGFLQFCLRAFQHLQRFAQAGIVCHAVAQTRRHGIELREARVIRLAQRFDAECSGLQQARGMGQPRMILLHRCPVRSVKSQTFQFVALELQQFALGSHRFGILAQADAAAAQRLPVAIQRGDLFRRAGHARIPIQQRALGIRSQQRLMGMLSVYIEQLVARFAHLLQSGAASVDETARTAAGIQHPAQQAHARIAFQILFAQPVLQLRQRGDIELGGNFCALTAVAHHRRIAAFAERQRQRVDQDGFARAGLAGQHGETRHEVEFQRGDDHEIANGQEFQHDFASATVTSRSRCKEPSNARRGIPRLVEIPARGRPCGTRS